jgi:hypothetical protein
MQIHGEKQIKAASITADRLAFTPASQSYVDTAISNLVNGAGSALDTLNELAAALGNDANFATTINTNIATKLSLSGGTMSGAIAMGGNKITGLGTPTNAGDAATKAYVDSAVSAISFTAGDGINTITGGVISVKTPASSGILVNSSGVSLDTAQAAVNLASRWVIAEVPSGAINGSNTAFTIANAFVSGKLVVYLNGLRQEVGAGNDYTVSGTTITFLSAPLTGDKVHVDYIRS